MVGCLQKGSVGCGEVVGVPIIRTKRRQLVETRVKAGYSQRGLARAAGLTSGYMSQIERGLRHPGPAAAKKICMALNVEFDDLFELDESEDQTA